MPADTILLENKIVVFANSAMLAVIVQILATVRIPILSVGAHLAVAIVMALEPVLMWRLVQPALLREMLVRLRIIDVMEAGVVRYLDRRPGGPATSAVLHHP